MLEFKYDTQLLIEGEDLDEEVISDYFTEHFNSNTVPPSERSTISSLKIWTDRQED